MPEEFLENFMVAYFSKNISREPKWKSIFSASQREVELKERTKTSFLCSLDEKIVNEIENAKANVEDYENFDLSSVEF
jgi:hypothetical protein